MLRHVKLEIAVNDVGVSALQLQISHQLFRPARPLWKKGSPIHDLLDPRFKLTILLFSTTTAMVH